MARIRFIMVGGFLGAGKTTTIARLASYYTEAGKRVGLVTNDQAHGLVDTHSLRSQGFVVGEVPGACFCCKFDDLISTVEGLKRDHQPDYVITEPVGSCTDLVATVIEPLRRLHQGDYDIAPLTVLLKPEHGLKILGGSARSGFSPEASYIFLKQIEEADLIVVNKVDKLSASQSSELVARVHERFPAKEVQLLSAKTGTGFEDLLKSLERSTRSRESMMEVDYDRYARGEAELGWLNASYRLRSETKVGGHSMGRLVVELVERLRDRLLSADAEPAHLKVLCENSDEVAIANLVGSDVDIELSVSSHAPIGDATLIINARAAADPAMLEAAVQESVSAIASSYGLRETLGRLDRFRPAAPVPTHRVGSS